MAYRNSLFTRTLNSRGIEFANIHEKYRIYSRFHFKIFTKKSNDVLVSYKGRQGKDCDKNVL